MRKKKLVSIVIVAIAALLAGAGMVSADRPGSSAGQFLMLGPGARPAALGNAYTAAASGADALYWNPGGLGRLERSELTLMHSRWFQDVDYNYAAFAWEEPVFDGHIAGGVTLLDYGEINITRIAGQAPVTGLGKTDANDYAVTGGYGRTWDLFDWGVAVKYIHQQIAGQEDNAVACDLGLLLNQSPIPDVQFGAALLNLGTKVRMQSQSNQLPMTFKLGAAYRAPTLPLLLTADLIAPNDDRVAGAFGLEYTLADLLALRVGYATENDAGNGITAGAGFSPSPDFNVDYAFVPYGDLGDAHRISLNYRFGIARPRPAPARRATVARPPPARALTVRQLIAAGLEHYEAERYPEACASFGEAARREPRNPAAVYNMALSYYAAGQYDYAAEWIGSFIAIAPNDANGYAQYGLCLDRLGRRAEAETAWRRALEIDPANATARGAAPAAPVSPAEKVVVPAPPAAAPAVAPAPDADARQLIATGLEHYQAGEYAEAIACFGEASRLEPGNPTAAYNMATSYYAASQYQAAAEWFDYYLALAPADANARAYYGLCLDRLGRRVDAEAAWRLALKIDPTNAMARALLNR